MRPTRRAPSRQGYEDKSEGASFECWRTLTRRRRASAARGVACVATTQGGTDAAARRRGEDASSSEHACGFERRQLVPASRRHRRAWLLGAIEATPARSASESSNEAGTGPAPERHLVRGCHGEGAELRLGECDVRVEVTLACRSRSGAACHGSNWLGDCCVRWSPLASARSQHILRVPVARVGATQCLQPQEGPQVRARCTVRASAVPARALAAASCTLQLTTCGGQRHLFQTDLHVDTPLRDGHLRRGQYSLLIDSRDS